jgi:hypothetical protein
MRDLVMSTYDLIAANGDFLLCVAAAGVIVFGLYKFITRPRMFGHM